MPSSLKLIPALAVCSLAAAGATPALAAARVPASQSLAVVSSDHGAFAKPDSRSHRLETVQSVRPITGARTVLPVLGRSTDSGGRAWLHVMLPGRPNSHTGWILKRATRASSTSWRIRVDLSRRLVSVYRAGKAVKRYRAVVGKPSTPTPRGRFFVEETVILTGKRVGSPYALALSARSNVLQQFDGGPGQIALHGLGNIGGVPGTAASHGCMRLSRRNITWLANRIGPGVPVTIGA